MKLLLKSKLSKKYSLKAGNHQLTEKRKSLSVDIFGLFLTERMRMRASLNLKNKGVTPSFISQKQDLRRAGFTLIELLMVITIIGIILGMTLPNFKIFREKARNAALMSNMHQVEVVIEVYHLEQGNYADDFYEDGYGSYFPGGKYEVSLGKLPTNPWTGKEMDPDDFNPDEYDNIEDITNTTERGPNDDYGYEPGEMRYGVYSPPGRAEPANWGLIGFDRYGRSLRNFTPDNEAIIFVLHN